jgi:hypothetical protein
MSNRREKNGRDREMAFRYFKEILVFIPQSFFFLFDAFSVARG